LKSVFETGNDGDDPGAFGGGRMAVTDATVLGALWASSAAEQ